MCKTYQFAIFTKNARMPRLQAGMNGILIWVVLNHNDSPKAGVARTLEGALLQAGRRLKPAATFTSELSGSILRTGCQ